MDIMAQDGDIAASDVDTIIINQFQQSAELSAGAAGVDRRLGGLLGELLAGGTLSGKAGEVRVLYGQSESGSLRLIVVGVGERERFDRLAARNAAARGLEAANSHGAVRVALLLPQGTAVAADALAQATVEGGLLALHVFRPRQAATVEALLLYTAAELDAVASGTKRGEAIAAGVMLARDLAFAPANAATPRYLADVAQQLGEQYGVDVMIGDRSWIAEQKMGLMQAVAQGAQNEPRFIVMEHKGGEGAPIVLVGKGITFDSGGLNLKSGATIADMKFDMAGAAAVIGTMRVVAQLNLPLHVIGICPCTENMPDGAAYRPSDVLTASNGLTVEIISTDAEGRLVLADALVYAARYQPQAVIDLATLTGTAVRAMGKGVAAALFSNDDALQQRVMQAGSDSSERVWPFPLYDDYRETINSPVADIKNSGGAMGGLGTSAAFLHAFVDFPWAHIDIAGVGLTEKSRAQAYERHEATGFGVRLLIELLQQKQA